MGLGSGFGVDTSEAQPRGWQSVLHAEVACLFVLYVWGSLGMHMSLRLEHISDLFPP